MSIARENVRYFVKAPVSGWHEVSKDGFERYVQFLKENASPSIPMEQLIQLRTRIETNMPSRGG